MPSSYEYGTFANYSPRGSSELSVTSRKACGAIKAGRVNVIASAVPHLQASKADALRPFLGPDVTGAELLFELISQRYERGSTLITSNLPFDEWTETFGTERLTGALLDRLTHHVNILEMNGDSYRLSQSRARKAQAAT